MAKFSINFVFNRKKSILSRNEEALIQMRIYWGGQNKYLSTGRYVKSSEWDSKRQMVKGRLNARAINQNLEKMRAMMQDAFDLVQATGKTITITRIHNEFEKAKSGGDFLEFCILEHERDQELESGTKYQHLVFFGHLKEYQEKVPFDHIDRRFVLDFRQFMLNKDMKKGKGKLSYNYTNAILRYFKRYYYKAELSEYVDGKAFKQIQIVDQKKENVVLTREEVDMFWNTDLSKRQPTVQEQRDAFVFRCFTGLSYIDYIQLQGKHFIKDEKGLWLIKHRHKTKKTSGSQIKLPLDLLFEGEAAKIIEPYLRGKLPEAKIFTFISPSPHNLNIRKIAKIATIEKHLSSHTARHTFKNLCREKGYPIDVISILMGHAPPKTTSHIYGTDDRITLAGYL